MRTDEGMVRIRFSRWYLLTVGGTDHPTTPLVLIKCLASQPNAAPWGNHPTAGPARDTIRDAK